MNVLWLTVPADLPAIGSPWMFNPIELSDECGPSQHLTATA